MTEGKKVPFDMKLEVVMLGVSDVDRAKAFYENLGWRLDIDISVGNFRGVQMTPHNSAASIIFHLRHEVAMHEEPKSTDRTIPRKSSLCCKFEQE
jgi:hypothetical protein